MKIYKYFAGFLSLFILGCSVAQAQDKPIGYWRAHMPYNSAVSLATDGNTIFTVSDLAFFSYNAVTGEKTPYSKVEGMSDVDMSYVAHDVTTNTTILAYKNGNIDLFKDNSFYNIPDFKIKSITGNKAIYHIYTENGVAYLSTTAGVIVIDLEKREIRSTYEFNVNNQVIAITGFSAAESYYYATTPQGLYRINKNYPNPQVFSAWERLSTNNLTGIASVNGKLFATSTSKIYVLDNDTLRNIYQSNIQHIDAGNNRLWVSQYTGSGQIVQLDLNYNVVSTDYVGVPYQVLEMTDGSIWYADYANGLGKLHDNTVYIPQGPAAPSSFDIYANNKDVLIAHGGYSDLWIGRGIKSGFSELKDNTWTDYDNKTYRAFGDSVRDIISIIKDPADGTIYAASFQDGLFILKPDGTHRLLKQNDQLEQNALNPGLYQASGLAFDNAGTLWITMFAATHELNALTKDGNLYKFSTSFSMPYPHAAAKVIIDNSNQKWYAAPRGGGVIVYNDNNSIDNASDDTYRQLVTGKGYGNLPANDIYSLAKDKDGNIWIGTSNGIGIVNCPDQVIAGTCEADQPIVQYDQFAGYLFQNEIVQTIAVDGANRKWIGTNNGVWLLSPTGDKIIYRFTQDDSPLPSNRIEKITIDAVTGDVYIGTEKGLVSYRGTATDGGEQNDKKVVAYPNPVPSGYKGTIAVKGLVANADVRITDMSGQLVYRTTALGGQAVWNGVDYKGHRPQSGVYLIFITNKDGSQTSVGKMVFME